MTAFLIWLAIAFAVMTVATLWTLLYAPTQSDRQTHRQTDRHYESGDER